MKQYRHSATFTPTKTTSTPWLKTLFFSAALLINNLYLTSATILSNFQTKQQVFNVHTVLYNLPPPPSEHLFVYTP